MDNNELGTNLAEVGTDLISRQAAIDAVDVLCQEHRYRIPGKRETYSQYNEAWQDALDRAEVAIGNLPSAQPATNCSEIPNNSDTISRQDMVSRRRLLSDLKELITAWEKYPVMAEQIKGVEVAIGYVELIPSAQPERIKGHWIEHDDDLTACECSVCHEKYALYEEDVFGRNYCPNCGAKMEE